MNFHQKAMLVTAIVVLLSLAIFLWIVVLDKGTLTISSEPTYEVEVLGNRLKVPENMTCTQDPCSISLPSGSFTVTFTKDDYFEEEVSVEINRGETTTIGVPFTYIPKVEEAGTYETFEGIFATEDSSDRFSFAMDSTYNKQRLDYTDPDTNVVTTWAYFDRALENPLLFANPELTHILVVDGADLDHAMYLIDGIQFERSYVGSLTDVHAVKWSTNPSKFLIQTLSDSGTSNIWIVPEENGELMPWPFANSLEMMVWDGESNLIFVANQDLEALEDEALGTMFEVAEALLDGAFDNTGSTEFFIGQYNFDTNSYRALFEVSSSMEIDYDLVSLLYDSETDRLYFTDGTKVFEVVQEG